MLLTLAAVFGTAFLAATILPFFSEVVVSAALADEDLNRLALWTAATTGNTLGAAVNWVLGRYAAHFQDRKWWPASPAQMVKGEAWFNKYGVWSLLLSWLPIGGDALTVIAGILRVRFDVFVVLVAIGKGARYAALIAGVDFVLF
ncbi:MAG: YqaA family protein [Rhodospirillaceae bacterium]